MAMQTVVLDGELIENSGADDPDLNAAFWEFSESIKREATASGSIAVYEVPTDASGQPRPQTYNKTKLFTVPVGSVTIDDICDRVIREFMEPGQRMMIQLLAHKAGERGIKLNRMFSLRRGKETGLTKTDDSAPGQIERLMRLVQEQRRADMAELREILSANVRPQADPVQLGLGIAEKMMVAFGNASAGRLPGAAPANDPNSMMMTMMSTFMLKMMEKSFDNMQNPPAARIENDDGGAKILSAVADIAKPLIAAHAAESQRRAAEATRLLRHETPPVAAAPSAPATAAPKTSTPEEKEMKLLAVLTEALPFVIANGPEKKTDPATMAELVLENLPEDDTDLNDALYALIQSTPEKFLGKLALIDSKVNAHAEWFEKFRLALNVEYTPDRGSQDGATSASVAGAPPAGNDP